MNLLSFEELTNRIKIAAIEKNKAVIWVSLTLALGILYYISPFKAVALTSFDSTFGPASIAGISYEARIAHFYLFYLITVPIVYVLCFSLSSIVLIRKAVYQTVMQEVAEVFLFAICFSYTSRFISNTTDINSNNMIRFILFFMISLFVISIFDKNEILEERNIIHIFLTYLVVGVTVGIFTKGILFYATVVLIVMAITLCVIIHILKRNTKLDDTIVRTLSVMMYAPFLYRVSLEICYIMNSRGIYVRKEILMIGVIAGIVLIYVFATVCNKKETTTPCMIGYVGTILSLCCLKWFGFEYQYIISWRGYSNLYELGNNGVVADTVLYGKLPVIDYFSAHSLSDCLSQIIYGVINADVRGTLIDPYGWITKTLGILILFAIICQIFDEKKAILFVCVFPLEVGNIKITGICFIAVLVHILLERRFLKKNVYLYWVALLFGLLYKYDEGACLGIASIIVFVTVHLIKKNYNILKTYCIGAVVVGTVFLLLALIYSLVNGFSIISRVQEWMAVSLNSGSTWATESIGDLSDFAIFVSYVLVPFITVICLGLLLYILLQKKDCTLFMMVALIFSIAQIINIQRTLIFHTYQNWAGPSGVLLSYIHWTIAMTLISILKSSRTNFVCISTLALVITLECAFVLGQWYLPNAGSSIFAGALKNVNDRKSVFGEEVIGKERVVLDETTADFVGPFNDIFDLLLSEDETFLDFANISSLYVLTGRKRPFYVAQSPSLLTDLYSQECYLEEIQGQNVPLAILGTTADSYTQQTKGIPHNIRYYKVAEYIYKNYRPLVNLGDFAIWCEKEKYTEYINIIDKLNYETIDYGYDVDGLGTENNVSHRFDYQMAAYLWANYDVNEAVNGEILTKLQRSDAGEYHFLGSKNINQDGGNFLLLEIDNNSFENHSVEIVLSASDEVDVKSDYRLTAVPGTNQYLIRVSCDYFWKAYNIDTVKVLDTDYTKVNNLKIISGNS